MKNLIKYILLAAAFVCLANSGRAADLKIATVDLRKVFDKYYKTIQSNVGLSQWIADMQKEESKLLADEKKHEGERRALIDKANDQAVSADERDKSKKAVDQKSKELDSDIRSIKLFDSDVTARLQEKKLQLWDNIVAEIRNVLNADAKAAGFTLVLDSSVGSANTTPVLLYSNGQNDITDSLIKELNATAPPGILDTNAPAASITNLLNGASPPK